MVSGLLCVTKLKWPKLWFAHHWFLMFQWVVLIYSPWYGRNAYRMKTQVPNTYQKKKGSKFSWKEGAASGLHRPFWLKWGVMGGFGVAWFLRITLLCWKQIGGDRGDAIRETGKRVRCLLHYSGANVIVTWTWVSSSPVLTVPLLLFLHTIQSVALAQGCCFMFYADTGLFWSPAIADEYLQTPLPPSLEQDLTSITSFIPVFCSASIIRSLLFCSSRHSNSDTFPSSLKLSLNNLHFNSTIILSKHTLLSNLS